MKRLFTVSEDCHPKSVYVLNSAQAVCFVITPWHLGAHQISLQHAPLLTRAAVRAGTNVLDPLPIIASFMEWMKAASVQRSSQELIVGFGGRECLRLLLTEMASNWSTWKMRS